MRMDIPVAPIFSVMFLDVPGPPLLQEVITVTYNQRHCVDAYQCVLFICQTCVRVHSFHSNQGPVTTSYPHQTQGDEPLQLWGKNNGIMYQVSETGYRGRQSS